MTLFGVSRSEVFSEVSAWRVFSVCLVISVEAAAFSDSVYLVLP